MQIGLMAPQGWKGEYDGWAPADAWNRTIELARQAESLGFESLWVFDHFHTVPRPTEEITFESFTVLSALAMATERVRLGHMVICAGFRNPAYTAKLASTLDVISGGRFELGIGAGWKEDEWLAYGYGFPPIGERMDAFGDALEVISRMLGPGRATFEGSHAHVRGAINVPKGIQQPRIPVIVGGNGERRTLAIAARLGDGCNLPSDVERLDHKLAVLRRHLDAVGRAYDDLEVTVLDLPVVGRDRDDVWARVERHRGRTPAASYAKKVHAGTMAQQRERYGTLADRGVGTVFVSTPDLDGPDDVLALAGLNA